MENSLTIYFLHFYLSHNNSLYIGRKQICLSNVIFNRYIATYFESNKVLTTILQSVSANFTRLSSELYSEIDKWAGNFAIAFRSSEAISELRFEIRKFKLRVYQETSKMSEKKPDDELLNWMVFG